MKAQVGRTEPRWWPPKGFEQLNLELRQLCGRPRPVRWREKNVLEKGVLHPIFRGECGWNSTAAPVTARNGAETLSLCGLASRIYGTLPALALPFQD
jgi:hypothetical protein